MNNFIAAVAVSSINVLVGAVIACWKQLVFGGVIALLILSFNGAHASEAMDIHMKAQAASFVMWNIAFIAIFPCLLLAFIGWCLTTDKK